MSATKQCDCCDLHYDPYEINQLTDGTNSFMICDDCEDSCPLGNNGSTICNISGRAIKPDVEQVLNHAGQANRASKGFGTTGTHHVDGSLCDFPTLGACAHPSHGQVGAGLPQSLQQFFQQSGMQPPPGFGPTPTPPCSLCQHEKAARGCACSDCSCGCTSCAGSGIAHYGLPEQDGTPCPDCAGSGASKKPKPPPKFVTKTQGVTFDSALERMKLQLKAGLNDEGRPLKDEERKALERQVQIREPNEEDEARELLESELGTYDAEIRALLGVEPQ